MLSFSKSEEGRRLRMITSMLMLVAAPGALAQPLLQPFSMLIGHCWSASIELPGTDTHCFESVYGGQHVRDRHKVVASGHEVYAGETLYSVKGSQVIFTYWNSLGGLGTGNVTLTGPQWHFTGAIHATPTNPEEPMVSTWKLGTDGYEVRNGSSAPVVFKRAD